MYCYLFVRPETESFPIRCPHTFGNVSCIVSEDSSATVLRVSRVHILVQPCSPLHLCKVWFINKLRKCQRFEFTLIEEPTNA